MHDPHFPHPPKHEPELWIVLAVFLALSAVLVAEKLSGLLYRVLR